MFPPLGSAGASIRLVKLLKLVAEHGWSFAIFTQDLQRPVTPERPECAFLLAEVPANAVVHRVPNPTTGPGRLRQWVRRLAGPSGLLWSLRVVWQAWTRYRRQPPALVFATSPPFTNVAAGLALARLFNVPFVLDMRDDWVGSPTFWRKGRLRRAVETWLEAAIMRRAAAVVTVTPASHADTRRRYAHWGQADKFLCLPNGLDLDEFRALAGRPRLAQGPRFRLTTAAQNYRPDYRDLTPLLQTLERLFALNPAARDQLEVEFLGADPHPTYQAALAQLLPPGAVHYRGLLDRPSVVAGLWQADLFWLVQPRGNVTAVAGTLYEYWATGKAPVLLFADDGASSQLVRDHHLGAAFHFEQVDAAAQYMAQVLAAFQQQQPRWIERAGIEAYDRRQSAGRMAAVWQAAVSQAHAPRA